MCLPRNSAFRAVLTVIAFAVAGHLYAAGEKCTQTTTFSPTSGVTHQAVYLNDPAGQQTAVFDLAWGGALVSLTYGGTQHVSATSTAGAIQPILRAGAYQPTQAGDDQNRGTPMIGVACSPHSLWLTSGLVEYQSGASHGPSASYVYNNNQWNSFTMLAAPYVVSTYAYFVPNPLGTPAYYLKIDETITNVDPSETTTFTFDASAATPAAFSTHQQYPTLCVGGSSSGCTTTGTDTVIAGVYTSSAKTTGLAIAAYPSTDWVADSSGRVSVTIDSGATNTIHLQDTAWSVTPGHARTLSQYVMVGSWANAQDFALRRCLPTVSYPFTPDQQSSAITAIAGKSGSVTITTPSNCAWEVFADPSSFLTFTNSQTGTGNGTVNFTINRNTTVNTTTGNLTVAGRVFPFFQKHCAYRLSTTGANPGNTDSTATVDVTPGDGTRNDNDGACSWSATSDSAWVTITGGGSGTGSNPGTVTYSVAANAGAQRVAHVTVWDQVLTVTQAAGPPSAPTVTTNAASGIASSVATLNGSVNPNGSSSATAFEYGTTASYGSVVSAQTLGGSTSQSATAGISGLSCNTLYYFRAKATNAGGTTYGSQQTFTTTGCTVQGFYTLTPCRVIDTRDSTPLAAGATRNVTATGLCGIPSSGVTALSVNITALNGTATGSLTLFPGPSGATPPTANTVSYTTRVIASAAMVKVNADGTVNVYNAGANAVNFFIDVNGYFK